MKTANKKEKGGLSKPLGPAPTDEGLLGRLEFHRHAYTLVPNEKDPAPGIAFFVEKKGNQSSYRFCTCSLSEVKTCAHIKTLSKAYQILIKRSGKIPPHEAFRGSVWFQLASILSEGEPCPADSVQIQTVKRSGKGEGSQSAQIPDIALRVFNPDGRLMLSLLFDGKVDRRFVESRSPSIRPR